LAKEFISFKVGEGHSIFLWLDCWHPVGRLLDTYGFRIVYDTGSNLDARVSSVLIDGCWVCLSLGLISLWRFKAGCLMLLLGKETFRYGRLLEGSTPALKPGTVLGLSFRKLLGVMWSGFPWQSLDLRFSYGLFSGVLSLPMRECVVGVMRAILYADFVMGSKSL
jgi:hypothetical protein